MITVNFRRIIRSGAITFWRNGSVSAASLLVFLVTLGLIAGLFFSRGIVDLTLTALKEKVDVNVYLQLEASEADALALRTLLLARPDVAEVTYASSEEVLKAFQGRHAGDELILGALDEFGGNPLPAELNIRAKDPSQYETIAQFLESQSAPANPESVISKYNFNRNKAAIDRISSINQSATRVGLYAVILFIVMAITVVFNTIRLAIYSARDEIGVMRLMGADNSYIRGPFIVEGILYGFFAAIVVVIVSYPIVLWLSRILQAYGEINLFSYFTSHFVTFILLIVGSGVAMGAVSSYLAVRRYLRI